MCINVYRDRGCPLPCTTRTTPRSLVVVVTDGVAGTAAQWLRDTTFLGSAMSTTVHCCLVCCVDGSEGRWKEVHGVWWGEAASAKPMGGKTI